MRNLVPVFTLLPVLAAGAGCFSAEIDAPEICLSGLTVPFVPEAYGMPAEKALSSDDLGVPDGDDVDLAVMVKGVGIAPTEGVSDMDFVDALTMSAAPADAASGLPEVLVVDMGAGNHTSDGAMYAEPTDRVDIGPHLRAGDVLLRVAISGDLPDYMWQTSMDLCVHAKAKY
jgi:hypothetical protein